MLEKGTVFIQNFCCSDPITFEVLDINRDKDYLKVKCISTNGYSHEEEWQGRNDGVEFTEMAIKMGEYKIINNDKRNS